MWFLLTDLEQLKRWNTDIISDEPLTEGPPGPGTRSRVLIREGSKTVEYENEILVWDEPHFLEFRLT